MSWPAVCQCGNWRSQEWISTTFRVPRSIICSWSLEDTLLNWESHNILKLYNLQSQQYELLQKNNECWRVAPRKRYILTEEMSLSRPSFEPQMNTDKLKTLGSAAWERQFPQLQDTREKTKTYICIWRENKDSDFTKAFILFLASKRSIA